MTNHKVYLAAALLVTIGLTSTHSLAEPEKDSHKAEVKLTQDAIKANDIHIEKVSAQILTPTFVAPARITFNAEAMAHVGTIVQGRVVELKVCRGDQMKKDDELLVIESPELGLAQSEYLQKRSAVQIATNALSPTQSAYERAKALYESSKGIALGEVQKREAEFKAAQGTLDTAKAAVTAAENALHLMGMSQADIDKLVQSGEISPRFSLRAPIAGQIIEREVTLGEHVSPDKEALLVLANTEVYWVLADVPESKLSQIAVGAKARITVSATESEPIQGTIAFIDPSVSPSTRSVSVRIEVLNHGGAIRPGMFAQAEISANAKPENSVAVLAIPEESVQTMDGVSVVFIPVPGEENTFTKHPVTVGPSVGGMVPVLSGLKEGNQVVSSGSFVLKAELGKGAAEED